MIYQIKNKFTKMIKKYSKIVFLIVLIIQGCFFTVKVIYIDNKYEVFYPDLQSTWRYLKNDTDTITVYCAEKYTNYDIVKNKYYENYEAGLYSIENQEIIEKIGYIKYKQISKIYSLKLFDIQVDEKFGEIDSLQIGNQIYRNVKIYTNSTDTSYKVYLNAKHCILLKNQNDTYVLIP